MKVLQELARRQILVSYKLYMLQAILHAIQIQAFFFLCSFIFFLFVFSFHLLDGRNSSVPHIISVSGCCSCIHTMCRCIRLYSLLMHNLQCVINVNVLNINPLPLYHSCVSFILVNITMPIPSFNSTTTTCMYMYMNIDYNLYCIWV